MTKFKEEHLKGRFWILNRFIRIHARDLSIYAQMIYVCLCCYAGTKEGNEYRTFVGCRKIADNLNVNKDTISKHIKELEVSGFVRRLEVDNGRATHYIINTDPHGYALPSDSIGHKDIKDFKKEKNKETYKKGIGIEGLANKMRDLGLIK